MAHFLNDDEYAHIGRIAVASSQAEFGLEAIIKSAARFNEKEYALFVKGAMFASKLEMVKELIMMKLRSERRKQEFTNIISACREANNERVIVIHGSYEPAGGWTLESLGTRRPPGNLVVVAKGKRIPLERLENLAQRISESSYELYRFWRSVYITPARKRAIARAYQGSQNPYYM